MNEKEGTFTGLDLLHQWLEIAYAAFKNQADVITADKTLSSDRRDALLARAAMSMHAIRQFQEDGMSKIRTALDLMDTHYDLEFAKIKEGHLTITDEERKAWADDQNFCQVMLRGKSAK